MAEKPMEVLETEVGNGWIEIRVRVQPRSSPEGIVGVQGGALKVRIAAPPVDGKANRSLQALLAKRLGIQKADVEIIAGGSSRTKRIRLKGVTLSHLLSAVPEIPRPEGV